MINKEIITLGNNLSPPRVSMEMAQKIYDCVRDDDFDVATFNAILFAIVTYLHSHDVEYGDASLPWAEEVIEA